MTRAAIYARISKDDDGTSEAPERQLADCRALAAARGWTVVAEHVDSDLSAFRAVERPGFEQMLADLDQVDVVLVWRLDRLVRRVREFSRVDELLERHQVRLVSATQPIDTDDPIGTMVVTLLVAFAQMESETMSTRLRARERHDAQKGRAPNGGPRGFGHSRDRTELVDAEAKLVREAVDRVLAGDSLRRIVLDWRAAGVATTKGGEWTPTALRLLLRQARIAGHREHHGQIVARDCWPAIITDAERDRVLRILDDPARRSPRGAPRTTLLSGLLRCGGCGTLMRAGTSSRGQARYACPPAPEGCGGRAIDQVGTDEVITGALLSVEAAERVAAWVQALRQSAPADRPDPWAELAELRARDEELAAEWAAGGLSTAAWRTARDQLAVRIEHAETAVRDEQRRAGAAAVPDMATLGQRWPDLPVEARRQAVRAVIDSVVVAAAGSRRSAFDPSRLSINWAV